MAPGARYLAPSNGYLKTNQGERQVASDTKYLEAPSGDGEVAQGTSYLESRLKDQCTRKLDHLQNHMKVHRPFTKYIKYKT